ncbi:RusA family crossover junction endodeoxyribonuclease [Janthinobacterium sp. SUN120]|uniref:RusA family crossover junction endodeoxyribonuclease n=1 Tax=Janthinobacterium sp. SUN120 TaxID=3004099 RepID=UPI0025AF779D|nr:RusA family crossover junction endodeoxyribonuclease [Janthinobacterium sp. SUN120]MDN2713703.1 RusA family crossover junction endodeoxyribonuclease [Janthinobacterium sp. SUN120]
MVSISIRTSNCDQDNQYLVEELATASVTLELQFDEIVSVQSQGVRKRELVDAIHVELSRFKWLISGSVQIEFAWYLHGVERQETDKVGDIDNITKPILDALTGANGILVDDAQIGSVHTFWMSRNEQLSYSLLRLEVQFSNDDCIEKHNLIFIRYWGAMCVALNVDFDDLRSVLAACVALQARKRHRRTARRIHELGGQADSFLVNSTWDFHRTRLGNFGPQIILTLDQFKRRVFVAGLNRLGVRKLLRPI